MIRLDVVHRRSQTAGAVLGACAASAFIFVLHPGFGVRDSDGVAYILGARSIHGGSGYRSLTGEPLNHWPPGYSLLLSAFSNNLAAAEGLNYISFGATLGLLYCLLRRSEWSWQAAAGMSAALGAGFFRLLANAAHADIFTYALFLTAVGLAAGQHHARLSPALIWALLIPIKLIAVVFLPPALLADRITWAPPWRKLLRVYWPGAAASFAGVSGILAFNHLTTGVWIPSSHQHSSLRMLLSGVRIFLVSIPREFLTNWHSSIRAPFPRVALPIVLLLAVTSMLSLCPLKQPEGKWLRGYGWFCLIGSALLLLVRYYEPSVRLVGYGLIALLLGFRPKDWANSVWLLYGAASLVVGIVNGVTVNSLGSTDPRYVALASEVRQFYEASAKTVHTMATNAPYLLDLNANLPSVPVQNDKDADSYQTLLWVTLPNFDPGASSVLLMNRPGSEWCEQKKFTGAILFGRCSPAQ